MSYVVQIYEKKPEEGTITYLKDKTELDAADGFFSFTYYNHEKTYGQHWIGKGISVYIWGLTFYKHALQKDPFTNWKMLIYTDAYTYERLQVTPAESGDYEKIQGLLTDPKVVFAIVDFTQHYRKPSTKQMNGGALRIFRSRAPFDFPNKFVFMRDADTFWDDYVKRLQMRGRFTDESYARYIQVLTDQVYEWESKFLTVLGEIQTRMGKPILVVATGMAGLGNYKKEYHVNEITKQNVPYGIFAGMANTTPGVPVFQTYDAWDEIIEYLNARSIRRNLVKTNENEYYTFSDNKTAQAMGRDEQLYLYILMKKSIDNLFIYHIDLGDPGDPSINTLNMNFHSTKMNQYKKTMGLTGGKRTRRIKRRGQRTRKH